MDESLGICTIQHDKNDSDKSQGIGLGTLTLKNIIRDRNCWFAREDVIVVCNFHINKYQIE